jgi:hypothetical protein
VNAGDDALVRAVTYVGIGIAMLCLAAAIFVQVWWYRKGRATAKDLSELLSGLAWILVFGGATVASSLFPGRSLATSVITSFLSTTVSVWLVILTYNIVSKIRLAREGISVSECAILVILLILVTKSVLHAAYELPRTGGMQGIIVFAGAIFGLAGAWLQDTLQENKSKAADTDKVVIIKAS